MEVLQEKGFKAEEVGIYFFVFFEGMYIDGAAEFYRTTVFFCSDKNFR